jgi:hypothetical protein
MEEAQRRLLRTWLGQGLLGALQQSGNFVLPAELHPDTLQRYHEIARQVVEEGYHPGVPHIPIRVCVQVARLTLVERALAALQGARQ